MATQLDRARASVEVVPNVLLVPQLDTVQNTVDGKRRRAGVEVFADIVCSVVENERSLACQSARTKDENAVLPVMCCALRCRQQYQTGGGATSGAGNLTTDTVRYNTASLSSALEDSVACVLLLAAAAMSPP